MMLFWLFWLATAMLAGGTVLRAGKRAEKLLSFPTLASLMWLYLYVLLPFKLAVNPDLREHLSDSMMAFHQFIAFICLAAMIWGWTIAIRRGPSEKRLRKPEPIYNTRAIG